MKTTLGVWFGTAALAAVAGCGSSGVSTGAPSGSGTGSATGSVSGSGSAGASGANTSGATTSGSTTSGSTTSGSAPSGAATSGTTGTNSGSTTSGSAASGSATTSSDAGADASSQADAAGTSGTTTGTDGGASCGGSVLGGGPLTTSTTHLAIGVHDPSMIWDGAHYYLFATGGTLGVRSSADILTWTNAGNIFPSVPAWITTALAPTPPTTLWAPDISYFNGQYHVYYAGSTFGSNSSVIGLATTPSLRTPTWTDQGLVVQSKTTDNFNAIDPNVSFDENCTPWLAFGSFWSGIKLRKLNPMTGMPATDDTTLYSIASRNGGAIEAASIISHNGFYYLFVSFDLCCQGVNSTYRTMVGRATSITGPYTDMAGVGMLQGGADQLLATSGRYIGPGGGTAWKDGNNYIYVYHYYDGDDNGASFLQVRPIVFTNDWVTLGDPLFP